MTTYTNLHFFRHDFFSGFLYAGDYDDDISSTECYWNIDNSAASPGQVVALKFSGIFRVEGSYDKFCLEAYDTSECMVLPSLLTEAAASDSSANPNGLYLCNQDSTSYNPKVKFSSDSSVHYDGFEATVVSIPQSWCDNPKVGGRFATSYDPYDRYYGGGSGTPIIPIIVLSAICVSLVIGTWACVQWVRRWDNTESYWVQTGIYDDGSSKHDALLAHPQPTAPSYSGEYVDEPTSYSSTPPPAYPHLDM